METGLRLCDILVEEDANLTSITVHPDGLMMATGCSNGSISIWDIRSQNKVATMSEHKSPITSLKFSNKGIHLASGCEKENVVLLYNLKNRMQDPPLKLVHAQGSSIKSIDFDKYGTYIVKNDLRKLLK